MFSDTIKLVVFDMSGTTLKDFGEVEDCFYRAIVESGLDISREKINSMMGWSKIKVFRTIWIEKLGAGHPDLERKVSDSFQNFRNILEGYYLKEAIELSEGTEETLRWLRSEGVKIALTTGFYRKVADIILGRLGWLKDLDENYRGSGSSAIDLSLTSDQVSEGRPAPDMILAAMKMLGVGNAGQVINIGDTPSDLESGRRAGCRLSLGITDGSHTLDQLSLCDNDGLIGSMAEFRPFVESALNLV